jgi:hypothetical protein
LNLSEGGREPIKLAYAKSPVKSNSLPLVGGVNADGYTTGQWEYMTVPAYPESE